MHIEVRLRNLRLSAIYIGMIKERSIIVWVCRFRDFSVPVAETVAIRAVIKKTIQIAVLNCGK